MLHLRVRQGPHAVRRKYDYWDTYTWVEAILPHIEQQAVYNLYWTLPVEKRLADPVSTTNGPIGPIGDDARLRQARHTQISPWYCPSDVTPIANEMDTLPYGLWRGSYRGCVGGGDMYGSRVDTLEGLLQPGVLIGAFGVRSPADRVHDPVPRNRLKDVTDGTSNTILISEGVAATVPHWGGPIGGIIYGNMGGALFSAAYTPNTGEPDRPIGPCPQTTPSQQGQDDPEYLLPCQSLGGHPGASNPGGAQAQVAARSRHVGGVNAAMVDGSGRFFSDSVDTLPWRWMGTRERDELLTAQ